MNIPDRKGSSCPRNASPLGGHLTFAVLFAAGMTGCGTAPTLGAGGTIATGSAGGAQAEGANSQLEKCNESLGTIAVNEDVGADWYSHLRQFKLGPTTPVLRMIIQQSNCFVVVERGMGMNNMMRERALAQSGEMRQGSNMGKGQMAAADFTLSPSVTFSQKGTQGANLGLGGSGFLGAAFSYVAGSLRANEAATTLLLVDNRSGVQLAAAEGSARNFDLGLAGSVFNSGLGATGSAYSNTPEGKIIVAAFMDSYNQVVKAARNYRAQEVKGGLGTGGRLGVQGGTTPASKELNKKK